MYENLTSGYCSQELKCNLKVVYYWIENSSSAYIYTSSCLCRWFLFCSWFLDRGRYNLLAICSKSFIITINIHVFNRIPFDSTREAENIKLVSFWLKQAVYMLSRNIYINKKILRELSANYNLEPEVYILKTTTEWNFGLFFKNSCQTFR